MLREARIAEAVGGVVAVAGGGHADLLEARLQALSARGARGIASFGLCGALTDGLEVGDAVIGSASEAGWYSRVRALVPTMQSGLVHADGQLAPTPAAKRALYAATGAIAIDMESHIAARVAARHGLPLLIARVVSDRADQSLPPAFARAMRPDGGTDFAAMLTSIARHPAQLPRFLGAAADATRALASLRRLSRLLGPGLGFADFA